MTPTDFGKLRRRVTLQRPATPESFDRFRQPVANWATVGTYWAEIRPLTAREAVVAKQVKAEASHKVTMRYLGPSVAVNPTCRLLFGSRAFGVVEVVNVEEMNRRYEITVAEYQQTGKV